MTMAGSSQNVAGVGVQHAGAEERGPHEQVDDVQHDDRPFERRAIAAWRQELIAGAYIFYVACDAAAYRRHIDRGVGVTLGHG
jgi:hypothetical protein